MVRVHMDMAVWVLFNIYHKGARDKSSKLGMPYFDPQKKKKKKSPILSFPLSLIHIYSHIAAPSHNEVARSNSTIKVRLL